MTEQSDSESDWEYPVYCHKTWCEKMELMYSDFIPMSEKQKLKMIHQEEYYPYIRKLTKRSGDFCWLTIRPKECKEIDFKKFIEKFVDSPYIIEYYYGYEWKPNETSSGLHCHLILKGQKTRINEKIKRKSKVSTFKKIGKMMFFHKWIKSHLLQDKIDYINGITHDEEKNIQKKINPELRILHNMPNCSTLKSNK